MALLVEGIKVDGIQMNLVIMLETTETCWTLIFLLKLVVVSWCAQTTADEANGTIVLVHEIILKNYISQNCVKELKMFTVELMNNKIEFTACGFFTVNYYFLCSIFEAIISYMIILFQFS